MNTLDLVREFMTTSGQAVAEKFEVPRLELAALRYGLNKEENKEITDGVLAGNLVEILDGICDLRYVTDGQMLAFGITPELFADAFAEVHRANMSKFCKTEDEAQRSVDKYAKDGIDTYYDKVNGLFVIYRTADDKVLKSCNWTEPDIKGVLQKHGIAC